MSLSPKIKIIVWLAIMLCFVEIRPISGYAYVPTENDHPFRNFELPERKHDKRSIDGQEQESESDPFTALKTNLEFPTLSDSLILNAERNLIHKRIRVPEVDFHGFDPNMIPIIPENV